LSVGYKAIVDAFVDGKAPQVSAETEANRKLHSLNVLTIGDSLFEGWRLKPTESWIGLMATANNWNLTNLGISGKTVSGENSIYSMLMNDPNYCWGGSAATHTWGNVEGVANDEVDLVIVEGGVNDWRGNLPLGTLDDTDGSTVLGAWKLILAELKATYTNARIVLVTSWYVEGMYTGGVTDRSEYVESLETVYNAYYANDAQFALIDAGDPEKSGILMNDNAFKAEYTIGGNDDNHLNAKGMELMAEYMTSELKALLNSAQS